MISETGLRQPKLITLILLTAISVLSLNMFLPSLAQMASSFEVSYAVTYTARPGGKFLRDRVVSCCSWCFL